MTLEAMPLIPENKRPFVEKALQSAFGTTTVESASLLTGGLSTAIVYRFQVSGKEYVLRLILNAHSFNDPVRQFYCLRLAADAGISPPVHYTDAADGISITDFIDTSQEPFAPPSVLMPKLVETLQAIQKLPLFPYVGDYMDWLDGRIEQFRGSRMLPEAATAEHFRLYARIQQVYPRHTSDLVSSHNDFNPNNLLVQGAKIWVIDWETAYRNDRYVDLANAANAFIHDPAEEEEYLILYFGETPNDYQRARFFLMRQSCRMYYAMGGLFLASLQLPPGASVDPSMETPPPFEFYRSVIAEGRSFGDVDVQILFGKIQLNTMLYDMQTPRFEEAIRCLPNAVEFIRRQF